MEKSHWVDLRSCCFQHSCFGFVGILPHLCQSCPRLVQQMRSSSCPPSRGFARLLPSHSLQMLCIWKANDARLSPSVVLGHPLHWQNTTWPLQARCFGARPWSPSLPWGHSIGKSYSLQCRAGPDGAAAAGNKSVPSRKAPFAPLLNGRDLAPSPWLLGMRSVAFLQGQIEAVPLATCPPFWSFSLSGFHAVPGKWR